MISSKASDLHFTSLAEKTPQYYESSFLYLFHTREQTRQQFRNPLLHQSTGTLSALFTPECFLVFHMEFIIQIATSLPPAAGQFLCRGVLIAWERRTYIIRSYRSYAYNLAFFLLYTICVGNSVRLRQL